MSFEALYTLLRDWCGIPGLLAGVFITQADVTGDYDFQVYDAKYRAQVEYRIEVASDGSYDFYATGVINDAPVSELYA